MQLELRAVERLDAPDAEGVEIFLLLGWPEHPDLVRRVLARMRLLVCGAPGYWAALGVPRRPAELAQHPCLRLRNPDGTVPDLWEFERGAEKETVAVGGWLVSSQRDLRVEAVLAGEGIGRFGDLTPRDYVASRRLVPVLLDWDSKFAPPVNLLYRPSQRRQPRVRAFIDFATELFARLEAERDARFALRVPTERPSWQRRRPARASTVLRGR